MYSTIVVRMVKITFSFSSPLLPFFFHSVFYLFRFISIDSLFIFLKLTI